MPHLSRPYNYWEPVTKQRREAICQSLTTTTLKLLAKSQRYAESGSKTTAAGLITNKTSYDRDDGRTTNEVEADGRLLDERVNGASTSMQLLKNLHWLRSCDSCNEGANGSGGRFDSSGRNKEEVAGGIRSFLDSQQTLRSQMDSGPDRKSVTASNTACSSNQSTAAFLNELKATTAKRITKEDLLDQYESVWANADIEEEPQVIKCGLPEQKRPTEPENYVDIDECMRRLMNDDETLTDVNLNNMKRIAIPSLQKLLSCLQNNHHLKKLSLANMNLSDHALEPLVEAVKHNRTLESINVETNFLSGEFLVRLLQAALEQQTLREIKAVNQSMTFSNTAEKDITKAIYRNRGLWKISVNVRLPEARQKIDKALLRNSELRRLRRKIDAMERDGK